MIDTKENINLSEDVKETLRQALIKPHNSMRELTKGSLFLFMKYFWDTYSDDTFVPNWHIEYLCKELEKIAYRVGNKEEKEYDLIINIPPGTTKTATVSIFFPVWCWVNWYWMRFITTSHSDTLSLESAEYSRDIIRSEKFRQLFPEIDIKQDKDTKSNFRIVKKDFHTIGFTPRIKRGGGRVSTSVGSRITGFHAHILIPDDIIDPKRAISEVGIKTANEYLDHTLSTRKTDKRISMMVMIMQRLHQKDPTGHILSKQKGNVKHICLPGEILNYKKQLQPKELEKYYKDNLLDPVRMSWKVLKDMEADLGQYGFTGQVGQKPTPPGGGMFKIDNIQIIDSLPSSINFINVVRYWDKAATEYKKEQRVGARTAGVKMAKLQNGKIVILDCKRGAWATEQREQIIKSTAEADELVKERLGNNRTLIYVEQEPGSGGKDSARSTILNLSGYMIYADRPSGDKIYRADPFSVQVNEGNVLMLRGEWNKEYLDEMENFPFSATKDQIDASSGAFSKLSTKKIARAI